LSVTPSIGIAAFPTDARDRATLIERADQALYHAKKTGRNRVVTYPEYALHSATVERPAGAAPLARHAS
jgi:predicted signal transduction protein with EAL and GGDEF domain